ncbi:MAG: glucose-6-phosphate dehydrogenase [Frankiaceae bacterium]
MSTDVFVQFGASGDLAKKMTFASLYRLARRGRLRVPIVGVAFDTWDDDTYRAHFRAGIEAAGERVDAALWKRMSAGMRYVQGDYTKPETYARVRDAIGGAQQPLFYLETPPNLFETVVRGVNQAGMADGARFVIEKPFGYDLQSAIDLQSRLTHLVDDSQLYRIDHYLGKNAVEDIMVWRFANRMIEPLWNRSHIDCLMITMAEAFDVADRGSFYDRVGALKDVVQNHIMQVIGLLAMEPPTRNNPEAIHSEQVKVFDEMHPIDPAACVRGQYEGYLSVQGVRPESATETYVALRVEIDSWRWAGVPFYVRAGKSLGVTATEVDVRFRRTPLQLFREAGTRKPEPNLMRVRIGPVDGIQLALQAKHPGGRLESNPVTLDLDFHAELGDEPLPYELLLGDAVEGDATLFATPAMIEGTWRVLDPLLRNPGPVHKYAQGTMGPSEADRLVAHHGRWIDPLGTASKPRA